jgi:hypothetical protein
MRVDYVMGYLNDDYIEVLNRRGWDSDLVCWHEAIDNFSWASTPEGSDFWHEVSNADTPEDVVALFDEHLVSSDKRLEASKIEARRYANKVSGHQFTNDVYEFCVDSGICSSPSDSEWLNRWLCSTLNLG